MRNTAKFFSVLCILLYSLSTYSQTNYAWSSPRTIQSNKLLKTASQTPGFQLNLAQLRSDLKQIDNKSQNLSRKANSMTMSFPTINGKKENYKITEHAVLSRKLAAKFPAIKSYRGVSTENPLKRIYFSIDSKNFHGLIRDNSKTILINPSETEKDTYYFAEKSNFKPTDFECKVMDSNSNEANLKDGVYAAKPVDDGRLRTYRMALACTAEYADFHIEAAQVTTGTTIQKKEAVLAAMNNSITRINSVYENDLSIRLELIPNNDELIFLDPNTDGLTNGDGQELIQEIQEVIDNIIGINNYDIGHVFSTTPSGGDGIAQLGSVCTPNKARGVTAYFSPVGDAYDIDFVAHEIGHQFGATHTFNNLCNSNRSLATAVEPGSGSTIMAYAGICPSNVQGNSDAYFHAISISQIWDNITQGRSTCAELENIPNSAPVIAPLNNYTIPAGTAFVLDASVTDGNGDILTYSWEQQNNEVSVQPPMPDSNGGPLFRSYPPTLSSKRYFPRESDILNNNLSPTWEVIPSVSRTMNFSLLVRDNNPNGGQNARSDLKVSTVNTGETFAITSQTEPENLLGGSVYTVNWSVASTNKIPINSNFVNIYLIIDNDLDNPVLLSENTKNDGTKQVVIPGDITTTNARIMVKASNNIFFAINEAVLSIQPSNFALLFNTLEYNICQPNTVEIPFTYHAYNSFNETVSFSTTNVPAGLNVSFSAPSAVNSDTDIVIDINGTENLALGSNSFNVVATASGGEVKEYPIDLRIYSDTFEDLTLSSPADNETDVSLSPIVSWEPYDNANQYEVQISEVSNFSTILFSEIVNINEYQVPQLEETQTYFWRVKPINTCGEGSFSTPFSFITVNISCDTFTNDKAVNIPSEGANSVTSKINILQDGFLNNITVSVNITHTWLEDLSLSLISPSGTVIPLLSEQCGEQNDIVAVFSDEGGIPNCQNSIPSLSGTIKPEEALSKINGEPAKGVWRLKVDDANDEDGGTINSFELNICIDGDFIPDTDQDGVLDPDDNCPNTPAGSKVDINGCEIFSIPADNYNITITDESCRESNNGNIFVNVSENLNYTVTLSGNTFNDTKDFTDTVLFEGLSSGTYNLCFTTAANGNYQQCFEVVVNEPLPLNVFTSKELEENKVTLSLSGSNIYTIELNNTIYKTDKNTFEITLKKGINNLKVTGDKDCQGIYQELIISNGELSLLPNPVTDIATVYTSSINKEASISVYDISGQLVFSNTYKTNGNGKIELNLSNLPSGLYLMKIDNEETSKTLKVIKK
ncbi:proprotein convertase P-domain-containing protein [Galbibacter sp. BG1]|uniref:reprolysin-like metallopeptidase n=1 Tax=Galbibacter sp. BG1 TaxID=1170699 RepID=UPI0015BFC9FC|nr:zinc-dependent metalloprotease family protein [Galbibacter sp. BG1]QLE01506.1 proprotein convertase P-domain-containing protein [Galbibacter sp. BG1]